MTRTVWRMRVLAVCLLLTTFAFLQSPGEIAADTKLDLAVDPVGFMERALTLWDPLGFFGQLQNQAYGYLFPMGPFFAAGDLMALPSWVVQRLWWSLLLCTAFVGATRLAVLLLSAASRSHERASATRWAALGAGLVYALAPRMMTTLGPISAEVLPMALAPWMLVPLVLADRGRDPRLMAARSGVAVLAMGAVNAVATMAVLPLGVWWIATRRGRRLRLALWWAGAVALASLWWVVPLLLLGRYSPPFLDWIEAAAVTTRPNEIGTVLRGTSHWVAYVLEPSGPAWPAGWSLVSSTVLVLATGCTVAVALVGLSRRDLPERSFLVGAASIGLALVCLGHTGPVQGLGADAIQNLLDSALAPLRNVHKADVVLRLALAVAAGHAALALLTRGRSEDSSERRRGRASAPVAAALVAAIVVGLAGWPLWTGEITRGRTHGGIPGYWYETAAWLADQGPGRALVVPGSSFGVYIWGRSQDEPLQPIAESPWAVRDAVPLSSAGNIRLLDAVDQVLTTGRGSTGLAEVLARSGVRWVVVRNDLSGQARPPRPILVGQALRRSPGVVFRAGFGPVLPPFRSGADVADDGLQQPATPVEVWEVPRSTGDPVVTRWASDAWQLAGGPEALLPAGEAGLLDDRAVVLDGDEGTEDIAGPALVSDTFRRTDVDFGQVRNNRSQTLEEDTPFELQRAVHDYHPVPPDGRQPVAVEQGYTVRASSSGASVTALRARSPSSQPWSALDGDQQTAWVSGDLRPGVGQWWEVEWERPVTVETLRAALVVGSVAGVAPSRVRVSTDAGEATTSVRPTDAVQRLEVVPGDTRSLRITLDAVADDSQGDAFGLAEVLLPPAQSDRPVTIPGTYDAGAIVLAARGGERYGCVHSAREVQCSRALPRAGEERSGIDRLLTLRAGGRYQVTVHVQPRPGAALDRVLAPPDGSVEVSASSRLVRDPAAGPGALVDDDPRTAWLADPLDRQPTITVDLPERRTVDGLTVVVPPELAASRPLGVTVLSEGSERRGFVDEAGELTFPPLEGQSFDVAFGVTVPVSSRDVLTGVSTILPLGLAELTLTGAEDLMQPLRSLPRVGVACGFGPDVVIDGVARVDTSVRVPSASVLATRVVQADACSGDMVVLAAGEHRIKVDSTEEFLVERVELVRRNQGSGSVDAPPQPSVVDWQATTRTVDLPQARAPRILETTENANDGWSAIVDERVLQPVTVDGWRQGWVVPAGVEGEVVMRFVPQRPYLVGLAAGGVAAVVLVLLAVVPAREPAMAVPHTPEGRSAAVWTVVPVVVAAVTGAGLVGVAVAALGWWVSGRRRAARTATLLASWGLSLAFAAAWPWPRSLDVPDVVSGAATAAALLAFSTAALVTATPSHVGSGRGPDSLPARPSWEDS